MSKAAIELMNNMLRTTKKYDKVLSKVLITQLDKGRCVAELTIEEEHTNPMGGLHGGLSATLVDSLSSFALSSADKVSGFHVSVDINLTYLKGAKIGDTIEIESNTLKVGRKLSFLEVFIRNKNNGDLLVKGSHTKFMMTPQGDK